MRLISWNVNGLRACEKKGFSKWLIHSEADIVAIQEVRAREDQLPKSVLAPDGWHAVFSSAKKTGYSGVGLFSRVKPEEVLISIGVEEFDSEGRVQIAKFGSLWVVNVYFPNGGGKERDNSRVPYKIAFYDHLLGLLEKDLREDKKMLVVGDFNTAHKEIDLARPKANVKTSGFLPEEREALTRWIDAGWVDTFRHFNKEEGHYTWWSQRFGARAKNVGWRIDYIMASPAITPSVTSSAIHPNIMGSDHCPISVTIR